MLVLWLVIMTVALGIEAPLGSKIVPVNFPDRFCAGRRRATNGSSKQKAQRTVSNLALGAKRRRFTDGFNMEANLLSRLNHRTRIHSLAAGTRRPPKQTDGTSKRPAPARHTSGRASRRGRYGQAHDKLQFAYGLPATHERSLEV